EDDDGLLEELEREIDEGAYDMAGERERRLEAMNREMGRLREMKEGSHGQYLEIKEEKEVMERSVKAPLCVVHFYHDDFKRCKIVDMHLQKLAQKHFRTLFLKINVLNSPFLVTKLSIQVLPCVMIFIDGVSKDRIVGFEGLPGGDNFTTEALEWRLAEAGATSFLPLYLHLHSAITRI
ncbi:thioredoxin-like protein, partial [Atractiella rhizophila]